MNAKLSRITLYTNYEGWRMMDNIFNLIPILWRLKHMCLYKCAKNNVGLGTFFGSVMTILFFFPLDQ